MRNKITCTDEHLVVEPVGLDKMWSFKKELAIPWSNVRGATHDPGMKNESKGLRAPGLSFGQKHSGTFHAGGGKQFWNVDGYEDAVVIELKDEHFERLILSLEDPAAWVGKMNARALAD